MKRVAIIADSHFDASPGGRFEECVRIHEWIVDELARRAVDAIVHAGDVFERKSTIEEREAVARWLSACGTLAPTLVLRGNHDHVGADGASDLAIFRRLRTKYPILVEESCGIHDLAGVRVAAMAWPRKAELLALAGAPVSHEEGNQLAGDAMRSVLRGLGAELADAAGPTLFAAHAMVSGSRTSTGQPLIGCDLEVGREDLALVGAGFTALGHVHCGQTLLEGPAPMAYVSSPRRTSFGEVEAKGILLVEYDGPRLARWERIETPATPMLLADAEWIPEERHGFEWGTSVTEPRGAEIRFRYEVDADRRDEARRAAAEIKAVWLADGALDVKLEERVRAVSRARAPEIAKATSLDDQFRGWVQARGLHLEPTRETRLLAHLAELEPTP